MNAPADKTLADPYPHAFARYFAATRPAFLVVTLVGVLIGLAGAAASGIALDAGKALATLLCALLAHAGANVINDYFDALNGSDAANVDRLAPYTGGSRFIQNGYLEREQVRRFGLLLLAAVIPGGLWLMLASGPALLWIGSAGLFVGWAYSAPPFKLMARGCGELGIIAGWLLVVVGSDYVQRGTLDSLPLAAGLGFALLVAAILYINQFPDHRADAAAGKRTLVVRLGPQRASHAYLLLVGLAYGAQLLAVLSGALPPITALALAPALLSLQAAGELRHHAARPQQLGRAIRRSIAAANLHGLLLAATLLASRS